MRFIYLINDQIRFWQNIKDFSVFGKVLFSFTLLFLIIYKPFFLNKIDGNQLVIYAFLIGVFSIIFSLFCFKITHKYLKTFIANWNIIKELIWASSHFVVIGSFNYFLCVTYLSSISITWLEVVFYTSFVGIIPLIWDIKRRINSELKPINQKFNSILYVKSDGNYIEVFMMDGESIKRDILRSSILDFKAKHKLTQCHRSYLVNWNRVNAVYGNSNGGKLVLDQVEISVPYSRTYHPKLPPISSN